MADLPRLERYMQLMHKVQQVKRISRVPDTKEWTNTAEHSYELVMVAWYLVATHKLSLNLEKVLQYALAHDVIEAYAGDTYAYDEKARESKVEREAAALKRIEEEFPEFPELTNSIHEYEERNTPEARFVYAVDKLVDPINSSMETQSTTWLEFNITWDMFISNKSKKATISDIPAEYWHALVEKLESRKDFYFPKSAL